MIHSRHHAQTSAGADHGSRPQVGELEPRQALGRGAREVVHPRCLGNAGFPNGLAAVAMVRLVATGRTYRILIAPPSQPGRERCRRFVPGGRRVAASASRLRQLALDLRRALKRRGSLEPSRVNPCACKPSGETHRPRLSSVASFEKQHSERAHGTVLYLSGELPKASGDHQHEFC